jgi:enediyne biosynthesis protein E4
MIRAAVIFVVGMVCVASSKAGTNKAGFTEMNSAATGVSFTNALVGDASLTNAVAHSGAGLAIGDVDGDGWQDIYLCNLQGPNVLYRNAGNWRLLPQGHLGEAACADDMSMGAAFADVDGDRDLDLLVNGLAAGTRLFLNDGKGGFTEMKESGLSRSASATSLALADIDGDGDLDLYCTHYIDVMHLFDPTTRFSVMKRDGRWMVLKVNDQPTTAPRLKDRFEALPDGKVRELPEVDGLYRNDGKGHFTAIQFEPGVFMDEQGKPVSPYRDWGLSVMFRDLNGDGSPDIYVCNDNASRSDRVWINSGKGTFRAMEPMMLRHTSRASMGIDFADVDRDGREDFLVVDMLGREHEKRMMQIFKDVPEAQERERMEARPRYSRNMLFLGRPDGTYAEGALMAGVAASDWSWCPVFIDVDLDGYEDLLVTNGFEYDVLDQDSQDEIKRSGRRLTQAQLKRSNQFRPRWRSPNAAFRNRGDGTFEPAGRAWGFDHSGISYGMALGDLDNDGDLDVVVNNLNEAASFYRNDATAERIAVRLKGAAPNTQGIGSRIRLVGGSMTQSQEMISGGRYLSGDQGMRVFAADPKASEPMRLEVTWRNGDQSVITNVQANRTYEVEQADAGRKAGGRIAKAEPRFFFEDVSSLPGHVHVEDGFDDWSQQPSLPRRLSRLGPGVSWYDIDGDSWEDLIVTAAKGGKLAVYKNEEGRGFRAADAGGGGAPSLPESDQSAALGWSDGKGNRKLLVGLSNYERPEQESELAVVAGGVGKRLAAGKASIGPMAMADVDGDGDLDLFVGGRCAAGRYPEAVSSSVWINDDGELRLSPVVSEPFQSMGLATGATFSDLDGDGWPDLAVAVEWGPVRVFRNDNGKFEDRTSEWGFAGRTGWWTGITVGDFDGDGRLDLAVGNWGRNTLYELYRPPPSSKEQASMPNPVLRILYGDWNADGRIALLEAWQSGADWFPVHNRMWTAGAIPEVAGHLATHQAFARARVQEILGPRAEKSKICEATELRSGIFLNRPGPAGKMGFEWMPLPREAQLTPALSVNVGDFDGDGNEDMFLSQNFFSAIPEHASAEALSRDDNGRGLWLRGGGRGTFTAVDGSITGIKVYGEQRGAALADFNHDGRVDLCVSQNNGATKLYVNQRAKRGLRVTLHGRGGNPDAVGARLRLVYTDGRKGPVRAISAGSGYWSQDAAAQVMGFNDSARAEAVWIRWPTGKEETVALEEGSWDVTRMLQ